jgi:hypothetical protein
MRTIALTLCALVLSAPASAQSPTPARVPLLVSRIHKQHNHNWYLKAPQKTPSRPRPLTSSGCDECMDNCCGHSCCAKPPPVPDPCESCPEECCVDSCHCVHVGGGNPCADCPDACCGDACCPAPTPPPACRACDAASCCHDACWASVCTAKDAPSGQCDKDQSDCENGCCPSDHPFCCGSGLAPFCSATADCGASADGGQVSLSAADGSACAMTSSGAPSPSPGLTLLLLGALAWKARGVSRCARGMKRGPE